MQRFVLCFAAVFCLLLVQAMVTPTNGEVTTPAAKPAEIQKASPFFDSERLSIVAFADIDRKGVCYVGQTDSSKKPVCTAFVKDGKCEELFTSPDHRREGYATEFVKAIEKQSGKLDLSPLNRSEDGKAFVDAYSAKSSAAPAPAAKAPVRMVERRVWKPICNGQFCRMGWVTEMVPDTSTADRTIKQRLTVANANCNCGCGCSNCNCGYQPLARGEVFTRGPVRTYGPVRSFFQRGLFGRLRGCCRR